MESDNYSQVFANKIYSVSTLKPDALYSFLVSTCNNILGIFCAIQIILVLNTLVIVYLLIRYYIELYTSSHTR